MCRPAPKRHHRTHIIALASLLFSLTACAAPGDAHITRISTVAPNILALTIEEGRVHRGQQVPYQRSPVDTYATTTPHGSRWVRRDDKTVGALVGPWPTRLMTFDTLTGQRLDMAWATNTSHFALSSAEDLNFAKPQPPLAVHRKSAPFGLARVGEWHFDAPTRHSLYLVFADSLKGGRHYRLHMDRAGGMRGRAFLHDPFVTRSEAVHVSQLGFHPADPVKEARLSVWLGSGGAHAFETGTRFQLLSETTERTVFSGTIETVRLREEPEDDFDRNYNGTDVYRMDFSRFATPGRYRVYVPGVGCSYPFDIATNVWHDAFLISARSLYHQRSGTALSPPYADFSRPLAFKPPNGPTVLQSMCTLFNSGSGPQDSTQRDPFANLLAGATTQTVDNAWGGYYDGVAWNRRIQHLRATRLLLELVELFPDGMTNLTLNIPESTNALPDLVDEALWGLDLYTRMQQPVGGILGGIESAATPRYGEASWQESLPVMAYAPGIWASYIYAGDAARAAGVLRTLHASDRANHYHESALRAMSWAEAAHAASKGGAVPQAITDARNLAAAELYRLSGEQKWHQLFLDTIARAARQTSPAEQGRPDQRDAAFVYLRTRHDTVKERLQHKLLRTLMREANAAVRMTQRTGFGWTTRTPGATVKVGTLSVPQAISLVRAHALTGKQDYLEAAIRANLSASGCNPLNMSYTTGIGAAWPQHPLCVDARVQGLTPPPGLTVFGPADFAHNLDYFGFEIVRSSIYPALQEWPVTEAFFDTYMNPMICGYSIHETLAPNVYVWGYLAANASASVEIE